MKKKCSYFLALAVFVLLISPSHVSAAEARAPCPLPGMGLNNNPQLENCAGLLQVAGDARSMQRLEEQRRASKRQIRRAQIALKNLGLDPGPIDGIMGSKTSKAITAFQKQKGLEETGGLGPRTLRQLFN